MTTMEAILHPASAGGGSGATPNRVEVALSTAGVRTFACSVSDHCESGQIVAVYTDVRPGGVEQSSGVLLNLHTGSDELGIVAAAGKSDEVRVISGGHN